MSDVFFCRTPMALGARGECFWPDKEVGWAVDDDINGTQPGDYVAANIWSDQRIMAVCGLVLSQVQWFKAKVRCLTRAIDGPGGTLGEAYLPCGAVANVSMWLDGGDKWISRAMLEDVCLHERLHTKGCPHTDDPNDIMFPSYNPNGPRKPIGPKTVAFLVRHYGLPKPSNPDPGEPTMLTPPLPTLQETIAAVPSVIQAIRDGAILTDGGFHPCWIVAGYGATVVLPSGDPQRLVNFEECSEEARSKAADALEAHFIPAPDVMAVAQMGVVPWDLIVQVVWHLIQQWMKRKAGG